MQLLEQDLLHPYYKQQQYVPQKVKLRKNDVNLQFLLASDLGVSYKCVFIVNINTSRHFKDPSQLPNANNIDMVSLRRAIVDNISFFDKNYMILKRFNTTKAEFYLNTTKWINATLNSVVPRTIYTKFSRTFRLKKRIPDMIIQDSMRDVFGKFILRHFKKYMEKRRKERVWFKHLITREVERNIRTRVSNMFDYDYNFQWNIITVTLKTIWVLALMYATGSMISSLLKTPHNININKRNLFISQIEKNIKRFDNKKLREFMRKRRLI